MLLVVSPKNLFLRYFCFKCMLTICQMHLLLDPVMFADDTNLFFNHKDIKHLFTVVNNEPVNIRDWFTANKLSLNVEKNTHFFP